MSKGGRTHSKVCECASSPRRSACDPASRRAETSVHPSACNGDGVDMAEQPPKGPARRPSLLAQVAAPPLGNASDGRKHLRVCGSPIQSRCIPNGPGHHLPSPPHAPAFLAGAAGAAPAAPGLVPAAAGATPFALGSGLAAAAAAMAAARSSFMKTRL